MKKLFFSIAFFTSIACYSQAKKDTTIPKLIITDTTPLLTVMDLEKIDELLKKTFTLEEAGKYQQIIQLIQQLVSARVEEFNRKNGNR